MTQAPASQTGRKRRRSDLASALAFLAPNFLGFLIFTLFPVIFSFWMALTNWTLKPAVRLEWLGVRNYVDLLGVRPLASGSNATLWLYGACALALLVATIGSLWTHVSRTRGSRLGGFFVLATGIWMYCVALRMGGQGTWLVALLAVAAGLAFSGRGSASTSEERGVPALWLVAGLLAWGVFAGKWMGAPLLPSLVVVVLLCTLVFSRSWSDRLSLGWGTIPGVLLLLAALGIGALNAPMWQTFAPRDERFWQYLYNTAYLMIGIPFGIAGSLALALLLNNELRGASGRRWATMGLCLLGAVMTLVLVWPLGGPSVGPNLAVVGCVLWLIAALGAAFDVVAFRTIYYLPSFTAGVALLILWKALYNAETGPINVALVSIGGFFGVHIDPPDWLASVEWAKPALIIMGVWMGIGGTNMLLYLAGLSNVQPELLDAADVDGASPWQRFGNVIWPQLAPTTFFISIMSIIGGLQGGFEQARVMTGGGPAGSTTTLSYYIYNKAFQDLDLGYAASISWVLFAAIFLATIVNWRFGKDIEVES